MKTDDLIAALAADTLPPARPERAALWLVPALAVAGTTLYALIGLRSDLGATLAPLTLPKTLLPLALGLMALALALRQCRPAAPTGHLPWAMLALPALAAALAVLQLLLSEPSGWAMQATGKTMIPCLVTIPTVAILPLATLLAALRRGAPMSPARTGLVAGLAAGGMAATLYSLHCTEDSPLFWALWYALAIAISGAIGTLAGWRLLRW